MARRYSMSQRAEGVRRTRLRIEMALLRLLGSKTYRSLTVADIAREADVSGRTIQRHYGSKEEILAATIRYPGAAVAEEWAGIPPARSAPEAVLQLVQGAFSLYARHSVETWVAHSHAEDSPELRETLWNGIRSRLKRIEEMLERWASSLAVDREEAKRLLVGMTSYLTYRAFTEFGGISAEEATATVGAMLVSRLVGQPRPQLRPHVFALFSGPLEEERLTASLVRDGLERGDKVVLVTGPARRVEYARALRRAGIATEAAVGRGALEVLSWDDVHFAAGAFDPGRHLRRLEELLLRSREEGFAMARLLVNMDWFFERRPGVEGCFQMEQGWSVISDGYPDLGVCMCDAANFSGEPLMMALRCHPTLLAAGELMANPFYEVSN